MTCRCISYNQPQPYQDVPSVMLTAPEWAGATRPVCVDACIAPVIQALWAEKIWTENCCCGHNGQFPRAVIVHRSDRKRAEEVIARLGDSADVGAWELVWSSQVQDGNRRLDPLHSPVASTMRNRAFDDVDILALFDAMEAEIRVHRKTFCNDPSRTHTLEERG